MNVGALVTRNRVTLHLCVMVIPTEEQQIGLSGSWMGFFFSSFFVFFFTMPSCRICKARPLGGHSSDDSHLKKKHPPPPLPPLLARTPDQPTGPPRSTSFPSSYSLSLRPTRCHGNRRPWRKSTSGRRGAAMKCETAAKTNNNINNNRSRMRFYTTEVRFSRWCQMVFAL